MANFETISVIGLGYIGLPTASAFASQRKRVIGVDIHPKTVETINRGDIHIVEPELDLVVKTVVSQGFLRATLKPEPADAFLIAVPTPFKGEHEPDVTYVEAATRSIAPVLRRGNLVILESTSPVGTTENVSRWLAEGRPDLRFPHQGPDPDVHVAYCPERVLPGKIIKELVHNDRVIGGMTPRCSELAVELYKIFVKGECITTQARTAEMCKLAENSFRDVNIAFANELSIVCEKLGIDVWELIQLANRHPRVKILQPGPGVGGHCIAVDPWFIVSGAPKEAKLIRTAREVNDGKPHWVIDKVKRKIAESGRPKSIVACLGLSFKPNIDDLRESPALEIAQILSELPDVELLAVEPYITALPPSLPRARLCALNEAKAKADIFVLLVPHDAFKTDGLKLPDRTVVDACGLLTAPLHFASPAKGAAPTPSPRTTDSGR